MNNLIGIIIAVLAIVGGGLYFINSQNTAQAPVSAVMEKDGDAMEKHSDDSMEKMEKGDAMEKKEGEDAMMKKDEDVMEKMEKEDVIMKKDEEVMEKKEDQNVSINKGAPVEELQKTPGVFKAYSAQAAAASDTDIVIGFFADWCPSCRALKSDINSDLSAIPAGLTILEANYDTETELKNRYGVNLQHTLVQVDSQGNKIQSWRGGNTLDSVIARVQ